MTRGKDKVHTMTQTQKALLDNTIASLVKAGADAQTIATVTGSLIAQFDASPVGVKGDRPKPAPKKPELVEFKKANGEVKMVSKAQADAWTKYRDRPHMTAEEREAKLADWAVAREDYKPSDELIAAIKKDRCITRKQAKELGFVGTKEDLRTLKAKILG